MDPRKPGPYTYGNNVFPYEPFYIGKGTGYRIHAHFTEAKRYMRDGIPVDAEEMAKVNRIIEIFNLDLKPESSKIVEGLNEFEAFEHETHYINTIGRVATRMGPLLNENDGTQFVGPQPLKLNGIKGMDNVHTSENDLAYPRVILNADVSSTGRLTKRSGFVKKLHLPGCHSLFSCSFGIFVCAQNTLYQVKNHETAIPLFSLPGPDDARVYYATDERSIVFGNSHFLNVIEPSDYFSVSPLNPFTTNAPFCIPSDGNLPPGDYRVCYTYTMKDGSLSAPSAHTTVSLPNGGGIDCLTPHGCQFWCGSVTDDFTFYRCNASPTGHITSIDTMDALPNLGFVPIHNLENIHISFGRLWGSSGSRLYYSAPFCYHSMRPTFYFEFGSEINMVAPVVGQGSGGIYVGCENLTSFLTGTDPSDMFVRKVGSGAVKGTLAYCSHVPELGNNVPAWMAKDGVCIGDAFGNVRDVASERLNISPASKGASFFRMNNGVPQLLTNTKREDCTSVGFGDSATCECFRNGKPF